MSPKRYLKGRDKEDASDLLSEPGGKGLMIPCTVCEGEAMVSYIETVYHSSQRIENCLIDCNARVYANSEKGCYAAIL